ncbi:MAG: hypothetical protein CSA76_01550 [Spirochaetales bacterium]|nr:MAG: hypothetical protein CSA76_01550 [Spirochaetales bacterium]
MKMFFHIRRILFAAAVFTVTAFTLSAQDMAVATVRLERTEPVSGKQLNQTIQALEQQQGRKLSPAEKKQILNQLIDQILIIQAAEADKSVNVSQQEVRQAGVQLLSQQLQAMGAIPPGAFLTDEAQYRQVIQQQGMSLEEYEGTVRKQLLAEKYVTTVEQAAFQNIGKASPAELTAEYQNRVAEFAVSDSVWLNQIFFKTAQLPPEKAREKSLKAKAVYQRLVNTSATFADLVAAESEDEQSKSRGGLIGPVMKNDPIAIQLYGPEFIEKLFSLNVGETSEPIQSNVGWHIVKITEKKAAQLLPQDDPEVKQYLEKVVYAQKFQMAFDQALQRIVKKLRDKATVNYLGEYR